MLIGLNSPSDILMVEEYSYIADRTSGMLSRKNINVRELYGKQIFIAKLNALEGITIHNDYLYF